MITSKNLVHHEFIGLNVHVKIPNGEKIEIDGDILSVRPEDRIKKRFKKI